MQVELPSVLLLVLCSAYKARTCHKMSVRFQPKETADIPVKMARIVASVAIFACSAFAAPQFAGDSSNARILQEQRFNAGAGKFGSAFAQEDGVVYREESGGNNERIGQYSYIGDDGKTYTVKYSAGINGFRILGGDHIPSGGQTSADNQNVSCCIFNNNCYIG